MLSVNKIRDVALDNKSEYVYIIEFERGCKIGRTKNPLSRLRDYFKPWSQNISCVLLMETRDSKTDESTLLTVLEEYRVPSPYKKSTRLTEFVDIPLWKVMEILGGKLNFKSVLRDK